MVKRKRFSSKELAEWIYKTAHEALEDKGFGTIYYKLVGGGLAIVLSWSNGDDYQYDKDNPFIRPTSMREEWIGEPYMKAYCLEVSLRIAHSSYFVDDWEFASVSSEGDVDGETSLSASDEKDKCRYTAAWLSKIRTEIIHNKG